MIVSVLSYLAAARLCVGHYDDLLVTMNSPKNRESGVKRRDCERGVGESLGIGLDSRRDVMFRLDRNRLLVIVSLVLLITSAAASRPRKMQRLHPGSWGGPHIRIDVEPRSATIDYDCANGTIDGPLTIDSKGRFTWRGTHNREHGGPIRIDEQSNGRPAIYSGWIKGDTMTLTVKLAGSDEVIDTFTLQRGSPGRVFKCK